MRCGLSFKHELSRFHIKYFIFGRGRSSNISFCIPEKCPNSPFRLHDNRVSHLCFWASLMGYFCVRWWLDPLLLRSSVTLYQGVNQCCCFKSFSFGLRIRWSLALRLYVTQKVVPGAPEQTRALERWQYLTWSTLWRGEGKILGGSEGNWGLSLREDFWRNILNSSLLCIPQDHAWR